MNVLKSSDPVNQLHAETCFLLGFVFLLALLVLEGPSSESSDVWLPEPQLPGKMAAGCAALALLGELCFSWLPSVMLCAWDKARLGLKDAKTVGG